MAKRLFLSHSAVSSGAELGMLRLTSNFDPDRTMVAFASNGPLVNRFRSAGIETHVLPLSKRAAGVKRDDRTVVRLIFSVWELARYGWHLGGWISNRDVSLIVAYSIKSLIYGSIAARRAGVPLVWRVSDRIAPDYFGTINAFVLRLIGILLPTAFIVNSRATLATLWARGKRVLVLPPGVSISKETNVAERSIKRVAMVGRLSPWKGQLEFIEAFERVFADTDVTAFIIGGPLFGEEAYEETLRERVRSGPCSNQITLTGAVDNVAELLNASEILVHASVIPEPFGAVVLEGMNAGCAVIATRPGGPAEVITDDVNGLLVPCGDIDALADALRRLASNDRLRYRLSKAGRQRVEDYDVAVLARQAEVWLSNLEQNE